MLLHSLVNNVGLNSERTWRENIQGALEAIDGEQRLMITAN